MATPRYNARELTKHLREMAVQAHDMLDSGEVHSKAEALAKILWDKALGYTKAEMRGSGAERKMEDVYHPPEAWAIQLIYERLEGKVPQSAAEEAGKMTAAERVTDLARNRINRLTAETVPATKRAEPPKLSGRKPNGNA